jgi:short-subunit dehydrogenase
MQQTVLITGGTSGIGLELAKLFAADGYRLVLVARNEQGLAEASTLLTEKFDASVITIAKDLFQPESGNELYQEITEKGLQIDVLVNDAGQGAYGLFVESDLQRQLDIIQLNISSLVTLTHHWLKGMVLRRQGKILNLSSIAGKIPGPWQAVYHGTKAFVQSFTEAIRSEVKDYGVTVTALLPGVTDTDFFNKADMNASKQVQDKNAMADPEEVAKDGYKALMDGKDMIISGFKNKLQLAMNAVTPDETAADRMNEMQEPRDRDKS